MKNWVYERVISVGKWKKKKRNNNRRCRERSSTVAPGGFLHVVCSAFSCEGSIPACLLFGPKLPGTAAAECLWGFCAAGLGWGLKSERRGMRGSWLARASFEKTYSAVHNLKAHKKKPNKSVLIRNYHHEHSGS